MSNKTIYDQLRAAGLTAEGACGLMGNMQAESSMQANIAQRGMTTLEDDVYTAAADRGMIDFVHDSVGYGLCQWTYFSRKQNLLLFAAASGVSVGDEDMQVQFCVKELREGFPNVWAVLTGSHDLYECARIVCLQYERPAVNNVDVRYRFAQDFFEHLAGGSDSDPAPDPQPAPSPQPAAVSASVVLLQLAMERDGYWHAPVDGIKTPEFRKKLKEYAADVAAC
jgi:hypothetical protein